MRVLLSPHLNRHLLLSAFLILATLMGVKWYHIVVLTCISLMTNNSGHFCMCVLVFCIPSLRKKIYSDPLPIFLERFYLFIFRERGREGDREGEKHHGVRETSICFLLHAPRQGPCPQPKHVPWLGIELVTFQLQVSTQSTEPQQPGLFTNF